jgi:hypothetical protein
MKSEEFKDVVAWYESTKSLPIDIPEQWVNAPRQSSIY